MLQAGSRTGISKLRQVPIAALAILGIWAVFGAGTAAAAASTQSDEDLGRYIVVLKDSVARPGVVAHDQAEEVDGDVSVVYHSALTGYAATLPRNEVEALEEDPRVRYVAPDRKVKAFAQTIPTGVERTFATSNTSLDIDGVDDVRVDADVAIIDTGIDSSHPDLNVAGRTNCVPAGGEEEAEKAETAEGCIDNTGTDGHGHGTHVAGIVGAKDNGVGVVGVAPGARLWSVRVLNAAGDGYASWIIAGVDWVTAHASTIEVANMSLGGSKSNPVNEAVAKSIEKGVVYVVAAGNEATDAESHSPASTPDAITVSALADYDGFPGSVAEPTCANKGADDHLASFSNFGSVVDVAAPGVCIYSTLPPSGSVLGKELGTSEAYAAISGTSMASPHVAGAAAILAAKSNPADAKDVKAIRDQIVADGNLDWTDISSDGVQEPLLAVAPDPHTPPVLATKPLRGVSEHGATLRGFVNPRGSSAEYWFEYGTTASYGSSTTHLSAGSGTSTLSKSAPISGLASSTLYHYRIALEAAGKKRYGQDLMFSTAPLFHAENFGEKGSGESYYQDPVQFDGLQSLAVNGGGKIWAVDSSNKRLQRLTLGGPLEQSCTLGAGGFDSPAGIALAPEGLVFVSDGGTDRITVRFENCEGWDQIGAGIGGEPKFDEPLGVAFGAPPVGDDWSTLFVADAGNDRVLAVDVGTHKAIGSFGSSGSGAGQLEHPTDVSVVDEFEEEGETRATYAVVDSGNDRVVLFEGNEASTSFEYVGQFGGGGSGSGQFSEPTGIVRDPTTSDLFVTDTGNDRVQQFLPDGTFVAQMGSAGAGTDNLQDPTGIAVTQSGKVIVADAGNSRISVWRPEDDLPWLSSERAVEVDADSAVLTGKINPRSWSTNYWLKYIPLGLESSTWKFTSLKTAGSGMGDVTVSESISSLEPATPYAFQIVTVRKGVETRGELKRFFTDFVPPIATTEAAEGVSAGRATLRGKIDYKNDAGFYGFEYGTTTSYGKTIQGGSNANFQAVKQVVSGLAPSTTYHYCLWAQNEGGKTPCGKDFTFTTKASAAPVVATGTAVPTGLATGMEFTGTVSPEGLTTKYWFEYGPTTSYGSKQPISGKSIGSGTTDTELAETVSGLPKNTLHHFRIVAENSTATVVGQDRTFTTPTPPKAVTEAATSVTKGGATLNATVNPEGLIGTNYQFEYGETTSYGSVTPKEPIAYGTSDVKVNSAILGLKAGTTYNFRVKAMRYPLVSYGSNQTFTTPSAPSAATEAATSVKFDRATLKAGINPNGAATTYQFEYGTTTSYGTKIPISPKSVGSGTSSVAVAETPMGLSAETTYHYRVVASNEVGTTNGADKTLTTPKKPSAPSATTEAATNVKALEATLNATVNPNSAETTYQFEYGTTTSYGTKIPISPKSIGSGTSNVAVAETPTGLKEGTTYHYRVVASNEGGTTNGADKTLSTKVLGTAYFAASFGSLGSGNGQFNLPFGIADDAEGNLWVADAGNSRVQKLNSKGEYLSKFGTKGSGNGQLLGPEAIAVDSAGNIWVADAGNSRVQKLNSKGEYLSKFGTNGTGNGQFSTAMDGIAVDSEGNIWVADTANNRVQKFNSKGEYLSKFGTAGSGNGQFSGPAGIAFGPEGNVWVADIGNNRVQKFNAAGEYLSKFGTAGSGNGQFSTPAGIAIDSAGHLWVADFANNRVQEFNAAGEYLSKFGAKGTGAGQFEGPLGIAIDSAGSLWVADLNNNRVQKWVREPSAPSATTEAATNVKALEATLNATVNPNSAETTYQFEYGTTTSYGTKIPISPKSIGSGTSNVAVAETPTGLKEGTTYHYRVVASNEGGTTNGADKTLSTKVLGTAYFAASFGSLGSGNGQFNLPFGIADDAEGNLWVADAGNSRVQKLNSKGEYLSKFGTKGSGNGQLLGPEAIAVDSAGNIWVADAGNSRVQKLNSKGEYLSKFGTNGTGNGQFSTAMDGIAVDSEGNIWVADTANNRVQKFNSKGEYLSKFGTAGSGNGQFSGPAGIAFGPEGNVWVADIGNNRVQKFNAAGEYLSKFGTAGSGNGQFSTPAGIAIDSAGHLWVADFANNRVQEFNAAGEYLSKFGAKGTGAGQFEGPLGIAIDSAGSLWVADLNNNRVQKWVRE